MSSTDSHTHPDHEFPLGHQQSGTATAIGWSGQTREDQRLARVLVTPRQAWQFGLVPLARRGVALEFATSAPRRMRAERFVSQVLCLEPHAQILDEPTLSACLHALYPPKPSVGNGVRQSRRAMWSCGPE